MFEDLHAKDVKAKPTQQICTSDLAAAIETIAEADESSQQVNDGSVLRKTTLASNLDQGSAVHGGTSSRGKKVLRHLGRRSSQSS